MEATENAVEITEEALLRDLRPRVAAFARRRLADRGEAEDLVHEALALALDAWRSGRLTSHDHARRWALTTCRNLVANHRRTRGRRQALLSAQPSPRPSAPSQPADPWMHLATCLGQLRERSRRVLLLTYWEGLDAPAIGGRLSMKPGAVRAARRRAVLALRDCLGVSVG